jgi:hypothetical protein
MSADRRLPSALIGLLAVVLVTTALAWGFLGLSLRSLESVFHDRVEALALLHTVNDDMTHTLVDMAVKVDRDLVTNDSAMIAVRSAREHAEASWAAYLKTWFTPAESALVVRMTPTIEHGFVVAHRLQDTLATRDSISLTQYINGEFFPAFDAFSRALRELVALQVRVTQEAYTVSRARFGVARQAFLGAIVAACVLVLVALLAGTRRTARPLRRWGR